MPKFEFEISRRIEVVTTVTVSASDEDAAQEKIDRKIADGLADVVSVAYPESWDISADDTDYQLR